MASEISSEDQARIAQIVTDPTSQTYFFSDDQPAALIGAAMARVSRSPNDLRHIWLNEFVGDAGIERVQGLIQTVVTEYGDDSVQQLVPVQFAIEGVSNWATKQLEWPRIGMAYLEQSTRYIFFDQRDEKGLWRYYTPPTLTPVMRQIYRDSMDDMFKNYSETVRGITEFVRLRDAALKNGEKDQPWLNSTRAAACDAARNLLPVSTKSTIGFTGNAQSLSNLIMHLRSLTMIEAQHLAGQLTTQARRLPYLKPFLERVDLADRGVADSSYRANNREKMGSLTRTMLAPHTTPKSFQTGARLLDHEPRTEDDLLAWMIFPYAEGFSLMDLAAISRGLSEVEVSQLLETYIGERFNRRHKPGRALERAHFWWEIVDEYATFRDLQRHRMVDAWDWQPLTPRYGYSIPDLVIEAGFEEVYSRCFEISEALYRQMSVRGFYQEAQYATLLGHRMRYAFGTNLRELYHLIELRTQPAGHPGYREICQAMYSQLSEVYPRLAAGMRFVNTTGETEDLRRLAAERAVEFKRGQLSN